LNFKQKKSFTVAAVLILIAIVVSFYCGAQRWQREADNKNVEVLVDLANISDVAARENKTVKQVITEIAPYISGVVYKEQTIADMQSTGQGLLVSAQQFALNQQIDLSQKNRYNYLIFYQKEDYERVLKQLQTKMPEAYVAPYEGPDNYYGDAYIIETSLSNNNLTSTGLGFSRTILDGIYSCGLRVVPQIRSWPDGNQKAVDVLVENLQDYDLIAVGFNDAALPGVTLPVKEWSEISKRLATAIQSLGAPLVTVEFYKQSGIDTLGLKMDQQVVRMHPIPDKEIETGANVYKNVDRFQLAASERNLHVLLVRFLPDQGVAGNIPYLKSIDTALQVKGLSLGGLQMPQPLHTQPVLLFIICLGVLAGAWMLLKKLHFGRSTYFFIGLGFLALVGLTGIGNYDMIRKLFALGAVLVFPTLSVITFMPRKKITPLRAVLLLLITTVFSLIGAVMMVGILADGNYMLTLKQFSGVKVAHLLPLVLIGLYFWLFADRNKSSYQTLQDTMDRPVKVKYLILCAVIVGVLGIYLMRTGNDSLSVSSLERSFRSIMDQVLGVRPRTKEFLIGHPLLLLSFYLGYKERHLPLILIGSIGQVSLVNTFAHIHTPLMISLLRTINGLWLGIILGLALIAVVIVGVKLFKKYVAYDRRQQTRAFSDRE